MTIRIVRNPTIPPSTPRTAPNTVPKASVPPAAFGARSTACSRVICSPRSSPFSRRNRCALLEHLFLLGPELLRLVDQRREDHHPDPMKVPMMNT